MKFVLDHRYLSNLSWSAVEQLIRICLNFFTSIILVRYLGKDDFGTYSYVVTLFTFLFVFSRFGLNDIVLKEIAISPTEERKKSVLINSILLKVLVSIVAWSISLLVTYFLLPNSLFWIYTLVSFSVIFQALDVVEYYKQAEVNIKIVAIIKNIQSFISIALKLTFVFLELELNYFILLLALDVLLLAVGYSLILAFEFKGFCKKVFDFEIQRAILTASWPLAFSNIAIIAYVKMDHMFIYHLISPENLGVYAAAARLSEAWYFIPTLVATTFFPKILQGRRKNETIYQNGLISLFRFQILLAIGVGIFVSLCGRLIILAAYGNEYSEAANVLIVHIWAGVFISISRVSVKWYIVEGLQRYLILKSVVGLILITLLLTFAVPVWGMIGAACSLMVTLFFIEIIMPLFLPRIRGVVFLIFKSVKIFS